MARKIKYVSAGNDNSVHIAKNGESTTLCGAEVKKDVNPANHTEADLHKACDDAYLNNR